jgi:hypothetical protein
VAQIPVAVGLLLCEQVIIQEGTRNCTPVNCFSERFVRRVPTEPMSFELLAYLTDGMGEIRLDLVLERLDTLEEILRHSRTVRFRGPLDEMRFRVAFRNRSFPVAGGYQFQLRAGGELIAQKRFIIVHVGTQT